MQYCSYNGTRIFAYSYSVQGCMLAVVAQNPLPPPPRTQNSNALLFSMNSWKLLEYLDAVLGFKNTHNFKKIIIIDNFSSWLASNMHGSGNLNYSFYVPMLMMKCGKDIRVVHSTTSIMFKYTNKGNLE